MKSISFEVEPVTRKRRNYLVANPNCHTRSFLQNIYYQQKCKNRKFYEKPVYLIISIAELPKILT